MACFKRGKSLSAGFLASALLTMFTACGEGSDQTRNCGPHASCAAGGGGAEDDGGGGDATESPSGEAGELGGGGFASVPRGGQPGETGGGGESEVAGGAGAPVALTTLSVVRVAPVNGAVDADPSDAISLTFSEPLDSATLTRENIQLFDGTSAVPVSISRVDATVTLTPQSALGLLTPYRVSVSANVEALGGVRLAAPFESSFVVRDGAWTTIDAVKGSIYQISPTLPITTEGDVLLAWTSISEGSNVYYCPTQARWFSLGKPTTATQPLTEPDLEECRAVTAASNASGTAAVVWQEDTAGYAQQYRAGSWLPNKVAVSDSITSYYFGVGVDPAGNVTFMEHLFTGGTAWRSDASGRWSQTPDVVSSVRATSTTQIVFNQLGDGFAAWRAADSNRDEILVSHQSAAGAWPLAMVLPGSLADETATNSKRGAPAIAVDAAGDALALWVKQEGAASQLLSSRFHTGEGWSDPVVISSDLIVLPLSDRPALAFDGETFVAAWTGRDATSTRTYSARYDMGLEQWQAQQARTELAELPSLARMPVLGADRHHNLLLVWARGTEFAYARYNAAKSAWTAANALPGGAIDDPNFEAAPRMPLGVAANGRAALSWSARQSGYFRDIRLASFF